VNPIFNDNRLKLGLFGLNGKGTANSLVPEAHRPSWESNVTAAQMADDAGLEAIVSYSRWKGHIAGDLEQPTGSVLDPMTWAAGIAQATSYSAVLATTNAHTMHPITAAKQCATIDAIAGGRFGLNIVATWFRPELEMFEVPMMSREERYVHLGEWFEIVTRNWSEAEEFDFKGRYFQVTRAGSRPRPVQRPRPAIMNAGTSPIGLDFAARVADMCFIQVEGSGASAAAQIKGCKQMAWDRYQRRIQVWTIATLVQRETQREAEEYRRYYADEHADERTIDAWIRNVLPDAASMPPEKLARLRYDVATGAGGSVFVGDADRIARDLIELSEAGIDGVLFSWVNYQDGLTRFLADVLPRLEAAGLRKPFVAA
jgi:alkanesulfonate monooxygenase SsuD/methylene tetrahydromethanopterin reductase-like flavin-dependent oxidoreductase (luciferase family)